MTTMRSLLLATAFLAAGQAQAQVMTGADVATVLGYQPLGKVVTDSPNGAPYTPASGETYGLSVRTGPLAAYPILTSAFGSSPTILDMIQGVLVLPAGSTVQQANAIAAYVRVETPYAPGGGTRVGVGYAGAVETTVDHAAAWGDAIALRDSGAGDGTGRRLVGSERDFNVTKANTVVQGYLATGAATVEPAAGSAAFLSDRLNGTITNLRWPVGFLSQDNAAVRGFVVGTSQPVGTPSVNSQIVSYRATDASSAAVETWQYANATGLHVTGPGGARDFVVDNGQVIGSNGVAVGAGAAKGVITADEAGSVTITTPSLTATGALQVGTTGASLSTDGSGALILNGTSIVTTGGGRVWDGGNLVFGTGIAATAAAGVTTLKAGPVIGTPASSTAACTAGQTMADRSYFYTCVATDTWRRFATSTW